MLSFNTLDFSIKCIFQFKIASQEIGVRLQMEFDVLSELHEDNPVDYAIILSGHEKLEKVRI